MISLSLLLLAQKNKKINSLEVLLTSLVQCTYLALRQLFSINMHLTETEPSNSSANIRLLEDQIRIST
jgi:hypothetical protein